MVVWSNIKEFKKNIKDFKPILVLIKECTKNFIDIYSITHTIK